MTNPYGITEVDVPGAIGAYEAGQTSRVNRLFRRQQMEALERQAERDNAIRGILARASGGGEQGRASGAVGAASAYGGIGDAVGAGMAEGSGGMIGTPAPPAPPAPPPATGQTNFRQFIPELLAAGMEPTQIRALAELDDNQRAAVVGRWQQIAPLLMDVRQRPFAERRAYIEGVLPQVAELGLPQDQVAAILNNPSDDFLDARIRLGTTMAQALEQSQPQLMAAPQGGAIIGVDRRTGRPNVLYESPTIAGPGGEIYTRPPAASARPQGQTAINPQTGERIQFNPQTGQWEPVQATAAPTGSADLDNWNNAGRAGPQGPRTFR